MCGLLTVISDRSFDCDYIMPRPERSTTRKRGIQERTFALRGIASLLVLLEADCGM